MPGVVETTNTFATNDVITSTAMNNIIDQTLFTSDALSGGTLALVSGKMKVATSGITSNELATNAVTSNAIAADAVVTAKIADNGVTTVKIADAQVTTAKIVDANVTTAKVAAAAITAEKLNGAQTGTAPIFGVRAWVVFDAKRNAAGAASAANTTRFIIGSGNVSSVTKTASGYYTIAFTTALPNTDYAFSGMVKEDGGNQGLLVFPSSSSRTTASFPVRTILRGSGSSEDFPDVSVMVIG
jgi:hypothetical protein